MCFSEFILTQDIISFSSSMHTIQKRGQILAWTAYILMQKKGRSKDRFPMFIIFSSCSAASLKIETDRFTLKIILLTVIDERKG